MRSGKAAADIRLGKFENWIGPERMIMDTVRLYNEFRGVGGTDYDIPTTQKATAEYNSILASRENQAIAALGGAALPAAAQPFTNATSEGRRPKSSNAEGGIEPPRYCYRQPLKLVDLLC